MSKTIWVVDDEILLQQTVEAVLDNAGYQVTTYSSGPEVLDALITAQPDLIIVDMMMPEMMGKELVQKIREKTAYDTIRIMFLTITHIIAVGRKDLENLKVSDYIMKPFDNKDLVARVKKALGDT